MKKQIRLISIILSILILTTGGTFAVNMENNMNISPAMAKAYSTYIQDMEIWFGFVQEDKDSFYGFEDTIDDYIGLLYAELIDFDNDGSPELLCVFNQAGDYNNVNVRVLGFDGEELVTIHDNIELAEQDSIELSDPDFEIRLPFIDISANMGEVGTTTVEGKPYLYYINSDGTGMQYFVYKDFYTLEKGQWVRAESFEYIETHDFDDSDNEIVEVVYSRHEKPISKLEYDQDLSKFEKNKKVILTDFAEIGRPIKFNGFEFQSALNKLAVATNKPVTATPTYSKVKVNNKEVSFEAYNINDNNFFKLRDLAKVLNGSEKQFGVKWDSNTKTIALTSGQAYTSVGGEMAKGDGKAKNAIINKSKIYIDNVEHDLFAYTINDNNYFKLRDIGEVFDIGVDFDQKTNTVLINTSKGYVKP